jgi:hypothetical protein
MASVMFQDRTVIEAASWRLASELMRRHPNEARLIQGHSGGGQYDLLWILGLDNSRLDIRLNRTGTIQVHGRADGSPHIDWAPTPWREYLEAEPRTFLTKLERAAGWTAQNNVPSSTNITLTYRVLATLASFGMKTVHPIVIEMGYIDSSGMGGGPNQWLNEFDVPLKLRDRREDDFYGEPGYRFWIAHRDRTPLFAIEQTSATAWFVGSGASVDLMTSYRQNHKELPIVAALLLNQALKKP